MNKRKDWWNDFLEWAMYGFAAVCCVYYIVKGNWTNVLEAVLIIIVLVGIRLVVSWSKSALFPALRLSILLFITLTMFMAKMFGMYGVIPHLDDIEHLSSGVILCFVGLLLYRQVSKESETEKLRSGSLPVWFSIFFAVAMAGCWEIFEFSGDRLFGLNSQGGGLGDTMVDIICGSVGAVCSAIYLAVQAKRKKLPA